MKQVIKYYIDMVEHMLFVDFEGYMWSTNDKEIIKKYSLGDEENA